MEVAPRYTNCITMLTLLTLLEEADGLLSKMLDG